MKNVTNLGFNAEKEIIKVYKMITRMFKRIESLESKIKSFSATRKKRKL